MIDLDKYMVIGYTLYVTGDQQMITLKCKICGRIKKIKSKQGGVKYIYSKRNIRTCKVCDYKEVKAP